MPARHDERELSVAALAQNLAVVGIDVDHDVLDARARPGELAILALANEVVLIGRHADHPDIELLGRVTLESALDRLVQVVLAELLGHLPGRHLVPAVQVVDLALAVFDPGAVAEVVGAVEQAVPLLVLLDRHNPLTKSHKIVVDLLGCTHQLGIGVVHHAPHLLSDVVEIGGVDGFLVHILVEGRQLEPLTIPRAEHGRDAVAELSAEQVGVRVLEVTSEILSSDVAIREVCAFDEEMLGYLLPQRQHRISFGEQSVPKVYEFFGAMISHGGSP